MATRTAQPDAPTGSTLKRVEVFTAGRDGHHEGDRPYTVADLDDMVRNFALNSDPQKRKKGSPFLLVAGARGHKKEQLFSEAGLPADGHMTRVWREGESLFADFGGLSPETARLIDRGGYHACSAEVYDGPPEGMPGKGCMLRRVAWLGFDPPAIKSLSPLPKTSPPAQARFAERRPSRLQLVRSWRGSARTWHSYSEVVPMSKEEMLEALARHGYSPEALAGCDESALAEVLRVAESQPAEEEAPPAPPAPVEPAPVEPPADVPPVEEEKKFDEGEEPPMEEQPADMPPDEDVMEFAEPDDEKEWEAMQAHSHKMDKTAHAYREHVRKCGEKYGRKYEEWGGPASTTFTQGLLTQQKPNKAMMDGEVEAAKKEVREYAEAAKKDIRAARIDAALERASRSGQCSPKEQPVLRAKLLREDDTVVREFSEDGKTRNVTDLGLALLALEARPSLFAPALPGGATTPPDADHEYSEDVEVGKVKAAWRSYSERFRENYMGAFGGKDMVEMFRDQRKANPKLRAEEYLKTGK